MSLSPKQFVAALNDASETAVKALEFARESRERAEKVALLLAALPVPKDGEKGERGERGTDGKSVELPVIVDTLKELVAQIPPAPAGKPGRDGRDGKDADIKPLEARIYTELAALAPKAVETARTAAIAAIPELVQTAVSQIPPPAPGKDGKDGDCACLATAWKGMWNKDTLYQRGDVFGFRGASYVVLRDCRGILPSVASQRGPNPYYAVLAAAGAPGLPNQAQTGGGSGTVTSVGLTGPSIFTVSGSPVTTTGTLALELATQAANTVFAGPTTGGEAAPTFRGLVIGDIPDLESLYDAQGEADAALVSAVAYTDSEIAALTSVYQPLNTALTQISGLTPGANTIMQYKSSAWAARTLTQVWSDLMADPGVGAYAYTALPFTITDDKRLLGRDSALPPFTASEISIGVGLYLSSGVLTATGSAAGDPVTDFTMVTNRILGRTTAATGAVEELTAGSSLSLSAGSLNTIQDIRTSAAPTFAGLTLSSPLTAANGGTGISSLGTGVATALGVNVGSAGAPVINGGALGTPASGTVTNLTGTASININGTVGATTPSTGAFTTLSASGNVDLGVDSNQLLNFATGNVQLLSGATFAGAFIARTATPASVSLESGTILFRIDSGKTIGATYTPTNAARITSTGLNSTAIGATTPSTVRATTLQTSAPSGSSSQLWLLGAVAAVSPTSPNRTVAISVAGTTYYLAAKTTND